MKITLNYDQNVNDFRVICDGQDVPGWLEMGIGNSREEIDQAAREYVDADGPCEIKINW